MKQTHNRVAPFFPPASPAILYAVPSSRLTTEDRDVLRRLSGQRVPGKGEFSLRLGPSEWQAVKECLRVLGVKVK